MNPPGFSLLSAGELSKAGPAFRALPRSKPLRFRFSGTPQRHRLRWVCILCPSQVRAAQATRCLASTLSPGGAVHVITSLVPATWFPVCAVGAPSQVCRVSSGELISGCDPPGGCQPSRIPGRLGEQLGACSQFDRGCCLWGRICPFPSGSGWHLPASLPLAGMGQSTAG